METTEVIQEQRRLTRTRDGRWVGGVCAGLARYFDLNPLIYRLAFIALALAGGTGILLYAAAWLVIPEEGDDDSVASRTIREHRDRPGMLVGIGLLGFAAILALSSAHFWPSPGNLWLAAALAGAAIVWWQSGGRDRRTSSVSPPPAGGDATAPVLPLPKRRSLGPWAAAALIGGFGIVAIVDMAGGASIDWRFVFAASAVALGGLVAAGVATGNRVGSVVGLGFIVLIALAVSLAVRVPIFAGVGDRTIHPAAYAALDTRYRLGIGDLNVNLSGVQIPAGTTHVKATLGIGDMTVRVPEDVTVQVEGRAGAGEIDLFGKHADGTSVHETVTDPGTDPTRVLVLDARVGLGHVEVVRG
jgi:phage shock protein PspC (stress-responsive transcriptional regulator)